LKYDKFATSNDSIQDELDLTLNYLEETTPKGTKNIIVPSNHIDHLTRWLNECDPKIDMENAKIYHRIMFSMLDEIDEGRGIKNPFELYASHCDISCDMKFLTRSESFKIHGIEVAVHGDKGVNGSRGSRKQYAGIPSKVIIGHSHSPGISQGCYQVGTSSELNLEYNDGPSSWLNTHCLIYRNGKRQLVNIINGEWRA
jgi:hypothetical protein